MKSGIYRITSPSGKVYVGQAIDIKKRWHRYNLLKCKTQVLLYNSFLKYGVESHIFEVIEQCPAEILNERERFWQDFYDVLNGGLNLVLQNSEEKQKIFSEQTRIKISLKNKGRKLSVSTREKMSKAKSGSNNAMFGKTHSKEIREKMSGNKNPMFGRTGNLNPISKKVLNTQTGETFLCVREAAESINMNKSTLTACLNGRLKNRTTLIYC